MKKITLLIMLLILPTYILSESRNDLISYQSSYSVIETSERLNKILTDKGFTIFKKIDHRLGAKNIGIELPDTTVIIFGNPKIGSKLMQCAPTIAIDLPQKALIWKDSSNKIWLTLNNPEYLKQRHQVEGCDPFFVKMTTALNTIASKVARKQKASASQEKEPGQ